MSGTEKNPTASESGRVRCCRTLPGMIYSLRRPPPGLTLIHQLLWPLIFAQLVALKTWVRARYGRGVPYGYFVSRWGRVTLTFIGARPFTSYSAAGSIAPVLGCAAPALPVRLRLALADEVSEPVAPPHAVRAPSVHVLSQAIRWDSS